MSFKQDRLYQLIPTVYRLQDEAIATSTGEAKGPLKAFIELFSEQIGLLEDNLDQLYDDQFIETCAEWLVPYIGDLVGARDLLSVPGATFSERAQVANTLAYRRRKGTASIIEQLAQDITAWPVNVIEYFQQLSTTQYLNHIRPTNIAVTSVRNTHARELAKTPFDPYTHTVDVRNISSRKGKYNIPNIGIFLWRIAAYSITRGPAYKIDDDRFTFDCLGRDTPLYHSPFAEASISQTASIDNIPAPIGRLRMHKNTSRYYGPNGKSIYLYDVPAEDIKVCNLGDGSAGNWLNTPTTKIAIDPVLGRIAFPPGTAPEKLYVNYYYGFGSNMGAGEYGREAKETDAPTRIIRVPDEAASIQAALTELAASNGVIELTQNDYYTETPTLHLEEGQTIELRAADKTRPVLVLNNNLTVLAEATSTLILNGLLVCGGCISVPAGKPTGFLNELGSLQISHCTLLPGDSPAIATVPAQPGQARIQIATAGTLCKINNSITGSIIIHENASCEINNSIADTMQEEEWAYRGSDDFGGKLTITNTTVIGRVATTLLFASNTIFLSAHSTSPPVSVQRTQEGCARFSYLPPGSVVPKKYKCQPDNLSGTAKNRPIFNSLRLGDPAYGQLNEHSAKEIKQGADNGSEMGAFNNLYQPQRVANLEKKINEYLRFGLEAGIFFGS